MIGLLQACLVINATGLVQFGEKIEFSHKKEHSLKIWAVKLRFISIFENMLKNTATARSECTAKHENKATYNTDLLFLI